jgi:HAD superfamily hydrolase (TIGR01509 family)
LEKDILAILEREFQIVVPADFIQHLHHEHVDLFDNHLKAIDGMDHLFRRITIPKSMVSNGSVLHVERCLQRVGLLEDFKGHIFSANQVARPKPWPDVYLHAMQVTGVAPHEAVVVEDSPTGVDAAKAAGLRVIGFLGAAHITPGHDEELLRRGADFIAADSVELEAILANLL